MDEHVLFDLLLGYSPTYFEARMKQVENDWQLY
jgi:hypothetical protein